LHVVIVDAAVPHAVGQSGAHVITSVGVQTHAAVAAQDFVFAVPQESLHVVIVDAAVPHAVGQSGVHVITSVGVQTRVPSAAQLSDDIQHIVERSFFLHFPST
jgi:FixJ family two-component response regulator